MDSNVQAKVKTILTLPAHSISGGGCLSDHSKYWTLNSNDITDGGQCLAEKKPNDYGTGIPLHEVKALARVLLPEIPRARRGSESSGSGKQSRKSKEFHN